MKMGLISKASGEDRRITFDVYSISPLAAPPVSVYDKILSRASSRMSLIVHFYADLLMRAYDPPDKPSRLPP